MASGCWVLCAVSKTEPLTLWFSMPVFPHRSFRITGWPAVSPRNTIISHACSCSRIPIVIQELFPSYSNFYPRQKNYTCSDLWETIAVACKLRNEHYHPSVVKVRYTFCLLIRLKTVRYLTAEGVLSWTSASASEPTPKALPIIWNFSVVFLSSYPPPIAHAYPRPLNTVWDCLAALAEVVAWGGEP